VIKNNKGYKLHNWKKRQPWVSDTEKRSNISRFNFLAKNNRRIYEELQGLNVNSVTKEEYALLTNSEAPLKQRLEKYKQRLDDAISVTSKSVSESKPLSLSLSPTLSSTITKEPPPDKKTDKEFQPKKKRTPAKKAGTFKPKNKEVKNEDFSTNLSATFLRVNSLCNEINKLPKTSDRKKTFDPRNWAQKKISLKKHPGAIEKSLDGLKIYWERSRDPWSYCDTILGKVNGTFNEADSIAMNESFKKMSSPELSKLTAGLFEEV
jgi:hypothetical protein